MYKGYTNSELLDMFRSPKNKEHNFPHFLDKLSENPCQTLNNTSETIIDSDSELNLSQPIVDLQDAQQTELACTSTNSTLSQVPATESPSDSSDDCSVSQENSDVLESLGQMILV